MTDFVQFNEGSTYIAANGWPATVWFLLSGSPVGVLTASTVLAGVNEITGTGYARISQALPQVIGGVIPFSQMTWATGAASDWPSAVYALVACTSINNVGTALCAWNLQPNGVPRDLASPFTYEEVTPTYIS